MKGGEKVMINMGDLPMCSKCGQILLEVLIPKKKKYLMYFSLDPTKRRGEETPVHYKNVYWGSNIQKGTIGQDGTIYL